MDNINILNLNGGFINKVQVEYEPVNIQIKKIKNESTNIYNDEDESFYGIPLIDKAGNLDILVRMQVKELRKKQGIESDLEILNKWFINNPKTPQEEVYDLALEIKKNYNMIKGLQSKNKPVDPKLEKNLSEKLVQLSSLTNEQWDRILADKPPVRKEKEEETEKKNREITLIVAKYKKIDNVIKILNSGNIINRDNIEKDLKADYVGTLEENNTEDKKELVRKYNDVFNSIVPIYYNNETFFSFLKGEKNEDFMIINNDNYELYRSCLDKNYIINYFNLSGLFTFYKLKEIPSIIPKLKNSIYPNFFKYKEANILYEVYMSISKVSILKEIIIFYFKYLGTTFENWFNTFGKINQDNVYFNDKMDILNSFIITNNFLVYDKIYKLIDTLNIEDYRPYFNNYEKLKEDNKKIINDIIGNKKVTTTEEEKIPLLFESVRTFIKNNNTDDEQHMYMIENIMNQLEINKDVQTLILHIYETIYSQIMNGSLKQQKMESVYNFLNLNYLYSKVESSIDKSDRFITNVNELNKFIKITRNQIYKLLLVDLTQELYYYYVLKKSLKKDNFAFIIINFFYLTNLQSNNIVKNLTNLREQFTIYVEPMKLSVLNENHILKNSPGVSEVLINFYKKIFFSNSMMVGFKNISYHGKYRKFEDPRNDPVANTYTKIGRPFCGEIALLNLFNLLLWNSSEKKLISDYLPDTIDIKVKDFFDKYNKIDDFEKEVAYLEFFNLLENMPFELKDKELEPNIPNRKLDRDYGDRNLNCVYRYFTKTETNPPKIIKGIELRLSYFNLCRVLSYLLNLSEPTLKLEYIQNNLDKETLKRLLNNFKNPNIDTILKSYNYIEENSYDIFDVNTKNIKLLTTFTNLGSHSEMTEIVDEDTAGTRTLKQILKTKETFYDHKYNDDTNIYDITKAVYVAKLKGNEIFSEIRFDKIDDEESIKFFGILEQVENLDIPVKLIHSLILSDKLLLLKYIFSNFNIYGKYKWSPFIRYLIDKKDDNIILEYIELYLKLSNRKKLNIVFIDMLAKYMNIELFRKIEKYIDIEKIRLNFIHDKELFTLIINKPEIKTLIDTDPNMFNDYVSGLFSINDFDTLFSFVKNGKLNINKVIKYKNTDELFEYIKIFFRQKENMRFLIDKEPLFYTFFNYSMGPTMSMNTHKSYIVLFTFLIKKTLELGYDNPSGDYKYFDVLIENVMGTKLDKIVMYYSYFKIINLIIEKNIEVYKDNTKAYSFDFNKTRELFKKLLKEKKLKTDNIPKKNKDDQLWQLADNLKVNLLADNTYELKYLKYKKKYLDLLKNI